MDDDQIDVPAAAHQSAPGVPSPAALTGHPAVDEVLGSLDALEALPVADHVAVFDRAHEGLRRALRDGSGDAGQGRPADA